jgi:hypothetical protein
MRRELKDTNTIITNVEERFPMRRELKAEDIVRRGGHVISTVAPASSRTWRTSSGNFLRTSLIVSW